MEYGLQWILLYGRDSEDMAEVDFFFLETVSGGIQGEDVESFPKDRFEFGETRIAGSDKGAKVGFMVGWSNLVA